MITASETAQLVDTGNGDGYDYDNAGDLDLS